MPGKHHLRGFKIAKKNRLAATRLVDDALHRRWVKPPPPWKKARSAPEYMEEFECKNRYLRQFQNKTQIEQYETFSMISHSLHNKELYIFEVMKNMT